MKELSIEEKAKRYDEAFVLAKELHEASNEAGKLALEELFPQLGESEDERILRCLKEIVDWGCAKHISVECDVSLNDVKSWLKKQGSAHLAWSEEDEVMLDTLIADYEFLSKKFRDEEHDFFVGMSLVKDDLNVISWLKSLKDRYTWKPSEEQMKALSAITVTGDISYAGQGQELINLYNDLKKLTE